MTRDCGFPERARTLGAGYRTMREGYVPFSTLAGNPRDGGKGRELAGPLALPVRSGER